MTLAHHRRPLRRWVARRVLAVVALAVVLTGCTGSPDAAESSPTGGTGRGDVADTSGGTLYVLTDRASFDSLDPQRVLESQDAAFLGAYLHRTLVTYDTGGDDASPALLVPDLATDTGRPNDEATEWSFTLRDDATWADGAPITCADVKYGVSRRFADDVVTGGSPAPLDLLAIPRESDGVTPAYRGPYDGGGQELFDAAVTCQGRTITFRLREPAADFDETTTLLAFSPVRRDRDTGAAYAQEPLSSGPYEVAEYAEGLSLVLRRNPNWNPASDPTRPAHPDEVVVSFGLDPRQVDRRLIADRGEDRFAVSTGVDPANLSLVLDDDALVDRRSNDAGLLVSFLAVDTRSVEVLEHRRAIIAALDRAQLLTARGGEAAVAEADGLVSPALVGDHADTEIWDGLLGPSIRSDGDPALAAAFIEDSGEPMPTLTLDYPDGVVATSEVEVVVESLAAAGIEVEPNPIGQGDYVSQVFRPRRSADLTWLAWQPDWANASTVLQPLLDADSPANLSAVNQPGGLSDDVLADLIDTALAQTDRLAQAELWQQVNRRAVELGLVLPLTVERNPRLWGSGLDGVTYLGPQASYAWADIAPAS